MKTFGSDNNNDFYFDVTGNLVLLSDLDAVGDAIITAMEAQRSEMLYAMDEGMPTVDTAWTYGQQAAAFEAAARQVILAVDDGTLDLQVTAFSVTYVGEDLQYSATISTIFGETTVNG